MPGKPSTYLSDEDFNDARPLVDERGREVGQGRYGVCRTSDGEVVAFSLAQPGWGGVSDKVRRLTPTADGRVRVRHELSRNGPVVKTRTLSFKLDDLAEWAYGTGSGPGAGDTGAETATATAATAELAASDVAPTDVAPQDEPQDATAPLTDHDVVVGSLSALAASYARLERRLTLVQTTLDAVQDRLG